MPVRSEPEVAVGDEVFILASVGDAGRRAELRRRHRARRRSMPTGSTRSTARIYTTAMNPGLGGGPLLDTAGRLVGIVSLNLNEIGRFSLAIPIEHYRDHRDELLRFGRRPSRPSRAWLGLYCYTLRSHVVIAGLLPGGAGGAGGPHAGGRDPRDRRRRGIEHGARSTSGCGAHRRRGAGRALQRLPQQRGRRRRGDLG